MLGPKPKLVIGAGGAPGFEFQLVYFDVTKGREKELSLGAPSQEALDSWVAAAVAHVQGCTLQQHPSAVANDCFSLPPQRPLHLPEGPHAGASPASADYRFGLSLEKASCVPGAIPPIVVSQVSPGSPADKSAQILVRILKSIHKVPSYGTYTRPLTFEKFRQGRRYPHRHRRRARGRIPRLNGSAIANETSGCANWGARYTQLYQSPFK